MYAHYVRKGLGQMAAKSVIFFWTAPLSLSLLTTTYEDNRCTFK